MKSIILAVAGVFVLMQVLFLIPMADAATASVSNQTEFATALAGTDDTIELTSSFDTSSQITIDRPVTIEGNGFTIDAAFAKPCPDCNDNNSAIGVQSDNVVIQNLTVDGENGTDLHGINVYVSENIQIDSVTAKNFLSGLLVNGSTVTVTDIATSGNVWHGINVDLGSDVTSPAVLTINGSSDQTDNLHIYADSYTTKDVTVNDPNNQYYTTDDAFQAGDRLYMLKPVGEITAPTPGEVVAGTVNLLANYEDWDNGVDDDAVQWAVREGTCAANTNTVFGNVDGFNDSYTWNDGMDFSATLDTATLNDAMHCFVFNPTDESYEPNVRETREFIVDNTVPNQVEGMTIFQDSDEIGCDAYVQERLITVDWDDSTDPNFSHYVYQADDGVGSIDFTTTVTPSERTGQIRDEDGTYQYRVKAVDEAGNEGDWSEWCNITLDREPPVVDINSPVDEQILSGSVDILADVTDDIELSHYNLSLYPATTDLSDGDTHSSERLNDADWCTIPISGTVNTSANISGNLCTGWDTTVYPNGDYQIRLAARDAAGLRDTSDPFTGGTTSVHVIDVTIDNGAVESITDDNTDNKNEEERGFVAGATTEDQVLAETGQFIIGAITLAGATIGTAAWAGLSTRSKKEF